MRFRRFILIAASFLCFLIWFPGEVYAVETPASSTLPVLQEDCAAILEQLVRDEDWFLQLINPSLRTMEAAAAQLALYAAAYPCLSDYPDLVTEDWQLTKTLTEYFMIFVGGYQVPAGETTLVLADLTDSDDPAVVELRDEAGVPPPQGYIFVRFFSSRQAMPPLVRQAFVDEDVAGVTILNRYVAVLNEEKESWPHQVLQSQTLPATISHELVHAYVSSLLWSSRSELPTWYQEGLAIYFSGSGEEHTVVTPTLVVYTTPPDEYKQYDLNFKYLEAELGRQRLLALIRLSILTADPSVLLKEVGLMSEQDLVIRVAEWQQQRTLIRLGIGGAAAFVLVLGVMQLMPQVRCRNCGYAGKRKDFVGGICPNCKRSYSRLTRW